MILIGLNKSCMWMCAFSTTLAIKDMINFHRTCQICVSRIWSSFTAVSGGSRHYSSWSATLSTCIISPHHRSVLPLYLEDYFFPKALKLFSFPDQALANNVFSIDSKIMLNEILVNNLVLILHWKRNSL